jgi:iron-sulfur cluster assembly protein
MTDVLTDLSKPVVTITPAAIAQVKFLIQKRGDANMKLRLGVKGGGCSGLSYVMTLDERSTERDLVYEIEGMTVLVDKKSARFLEGVTLDYSLANLLEGGWKWINPNAVRSCGCGTSFTPQS